MKVPTGDPMVPNAKICDSLYSLQARVPFKWPIWDRFGSLKMMAYLDPSCNGVMIVVKSHDEDKKEFFGTPLPETPEQTVRINMKKQFRYFEKIDKNRVKVMVLTDADIGLNLMPQAAKNQIMKQRMTMDLPNFKKNFDTILPKYKERVQGK